jgi:hypothetical protein
MTLSIELWFDTAARLSCALWRALAQRGVLREVAAGAHPLRMLDRVDWET